MHLTTFSSQWLRPSRIWQRHPGCQGNRDSPKELGVGLVSTHFRTDQSITGKNTLRYQLAEEWAESSFWSERLGGSGGRGKLLDTAVSGEEVTPPPSITSVHAEDFDCDNLCTQLRMLSSLRHQQFKPSLKKHQWGSEVKRWMLWPKNCSQKCTSCFSWCQSLHHIKTCLHSTMTQGRLNDFMCSHMHRTSWHKWTWLLVAKEFIQQNERDTYLYITYILLP